MAADGSAKKLVIRIERQAPETSSIQPQREDECKARDCKLRYTSIIGIELLIVPQRSA